MTKKKPKVESNRFFSAREVVCLGVPVVAEVPLCLIDMQPCPVSPKECCPENCGKFEQEDV